MATCSTLSDGVITTGVKISGTKSFRLSCSKLLGIYGTNLQNPPEALLRCIKPHSPDYTFCQVDQSGAESLVVAYESEAGLYRRLAEEGVKPHVYVALHLFIDKFRGTHPRDRYWKKDPAELKSLPEWRDLLKTIKNSGAPYKLGKMTNHARSYKMKWPTFQLSVLSQSEGRLALSNTESKEFLQIWDELFPEVLAWQDKTEATVLETRTLVNLFGYPRSFYGKMNDALIREAISWVPQSSVGCITHLAYRSAWDSFPNTWMLLGQKHDSYLTECPKSDASDCCKQMCKHIELDLVSTTGNHFRMKSEASTGLNLAKFHATDNPEGMKEI